MKKTFVFCLAAGVLLVFGGCGQKSGDVEKAATAGEKWEYVQRIPEPIKKISNAENDVSLGDLEANSVLVSLPKSSFDGATEVELKTPEKVPQYFSSEMDPLGSPIEISAGQPSRLNEKMTVRMKFDKNELSAEAQKWQIRAVYYDGKEWDVIRPKEVDMEKGTVTFETYHFSLLGPIKVKDETKITEKWIHSQAVDNVIRDQVNNEMDNVAGQIADMILEKMGINDEDTRGKVLNEILNADAYKEIYDEYKNGNINEANERVALLAGQKIAENVPESVFSKALGNVVGSAEDIAEVSKAAGYAAEGQYKEAAKIIGEKIADKFLITTAGKIAVEVMDYQIQTWKNSEVEAAYKAYKNGADGVFWGYNVDPGDFDAVWLQMRGIRRQIELEAIKRENENREEAGMSKLTEKQEELVRSSLREKYRKQFAERSKRDVEIEQAKEKLRILVEAFKKKDLFSDSLGPAGLDKGYDFEQKLDLLDHFAKKMMRDTKRFEVLDKEVTLKEGAITADSIALGARIYFSEPDGRKKYQEYLKSNFGIDLYPKLSDLAGTWNGSMTITDVIISEELKKQIAEGTAPKEDGCDFSFNFEELKGKTNPISLTMLPSGENGGDLRFSSGEEGEKNIPFTYSDGIIKATLGESGGVGSLSLEVSQEEKKYVASGSFNISYKEDMIKILSSMSVSKGGAQ